MIIMMIMMIMLSLGGLVSCDRVVSSPDSDNSPDVNAGMISVVHRVLSDRQPTVQLFETDVIMLHRAMTAGTVDERRSAAVLCATLNAHRDALLEHAFVCDARPSGASSPDLWMMWSAAQFEAHIFAWSRYAEACEAHVRWCDELSRALDDAFAREGLVLPEGLPEIETMTSWMGMIRLLAPARVLRVQRESELARLEVELLAHVRSTQTSWRVRGDGILFDRDADLHRFIDIIERFGRVSEQAGPVPRDAVRSSGSTGVERGSVIPHRDH
jgi:hypothetical protein